MAAVNGRPVTSLQLSDLLVVLEEKENLIGILSLVV
jgi:hypothetical protein